MWVNVAITLVIPRGRIGFIKVVDRFVDRVYTASGRFVRRWDRRDALLASQPVATLGLLLLIWLAGFLVGYGLLLWLPGGSFPDALREAGSSLFTLGFAVRSGTEPSVVEFLAAASGLIIVALQIAYLPTLYAAYNRRETMVTLLGPRAGSPAWGPELLARAQMVHGVDQLTVIYDDWEHWSADVAESRSSYPSLLRFRSPESHSSWVVSQLAVLDAAALHLAACPQNAPFTARLCVQMGFNCLRKLTRTLRIPVDEDPRPDGPVRQRRQRPAARPADHDFPHQVISQRPGQHGTRHSQHRRRRLPRASDRGVIQDGQVCGDACLQCLQQCRLPSHRRGWHRLTEDLTEHHRQLPLLPATRTELGRSRLDGGRSRLAQRTLLITAQHQRGQLPTACVGEQTDQPRPKVIGDKHHASSLPLRRRTRHASKPVKSGG